VTQNQFRLLKRILNSVPRESWAVSFDRFGVVAPRAGYQNGQEYHAKMADAYCEKRAAYIATFDPVTVAALLEELEALRRMAEPQEAAA
jgi:hypothetical protein